MSSMKKLEQVMGGTAIGVTGFIVGYISSEMKPDKKDTRPAHLSSVSTHYTYSPTHIATSSAYRLSRDNFYTPDNFIMPGLGMLLGLVAAGAYALGKKIIEKINKTQM